MTAVVSESVTKVIVTLSYVRDAAVPPSLSPYPSSSSNGWAAAAAPTLSSSPSSCRAALLPPPVVIVISKRQPSLCRSSHLDIVTVYEQQQRSCCRCSALVVVVVGSVYKQQQRSCCCCHSLVIVVVVVVVSIYEQQQRSCCCCCYHLLAFGLTSSEASSTSKTEDAETRTACLKPIKLISANAEMRSTVVERSSFQLSTPTSYRLAAAVPFGNTNPQHPGLFQVDTARPTSHHE
ncbi:hypothetical protein BDZ97DRAFT_1927972 [Flammula alnicola]|nr:hypothetical protein BDZ97DRAFT_1927972 [Flammula alnicola]